MKPNNPSNNQQETAIELCKRLANSLEECEKMMAEIYPHEPKSYQEGMAKYFQKHSIEAMQSENPNASAQWLQNHFVEELKKRPTPEQMEIERQKKIEDARKILVNIVEETVWAGIRKNWLKSWNQDKVWAKSSGKVYSDDEEYNKFFKKYWKAIKGNITAAADGIKRGLQQTMLLNYKEIEPKIPEWIESIAEKMKEDLKTELKKPLTPEMQKIIQEHEKYVERFYLELIEEQKSKHLNIQEQEILKKERALKYEKEDIEKNKMELENKLNSVNNKLKDLELEKMEFNKNKESVSPTFIISDLNNQNTVSKDENDNSKDDKFKLK